MQVRRAEMVLVQADCEVDLCKLRQLLAPSSDQASD